MMKELNQAPNHAQLVAWVKEWVAICEPDALYWCDGTNTEYYNLCEEMVQSGLATRLNSKLRPDCVLFRSDPTDVARVEARTFIASEKQEDAGPTNNWMDPKDLKAEMLALYKGCMHGRTMYVIPYSMGPIGSNIAKIGVEITDSAYVVINMHVMTRVGNDVLNVLGTDGEFVRCIHSVGKPLENGAKDNGVWPCAPLDKKYISHFPETREIWSYGSGYGGNAILGKKCLALRIATVQARDEGWMAEHMLILKLTNPQGEVKYITGAFPSACGKTNLAMLIPTLPGWKVETVGDDIAWMKFGKDGRLYAINPENGFFGVAPGTSMKSNKNALLSCRKETIFTNCALRPNGDIWWEGMDVELEEGEKLIDWKGNVWEAGQVDGEGKAVKAAHPNARFSARAANCPAIAPNWEDPAGVPISAFLFGGRRPSTLPLVYQSLSWEHGVMIGSAVGSEVTAAALDVKAGTVRRDPFAMLPFCGYNMGDYFQHWLDIGKKEGANLPKIFCVNWFRKTADGRWLWPGFGDNSRVLAWIFDRCDGKGEAVETPIGYMPTVAAIDRTGIEDEVTEADMKELLAFDKAGWEKEIADIEEHYKKFDRLPQTLKDQLAALKERLAKA